MKYWNGTCWKALDESAADPPSDAVPFSGEFPEVVPVETRIVPVEIVPVESVVTPVEIMPVVIVAIAGGSMTQVETIITPIVQALPVLATDPVALGTEVAMSTEPVVSTEPVATSAIAPAAQS
jgi:hypothetical protein